MALWNPSLSCSCYLHICRKIESIAKKCVNLEIPYAIYFCMNTTKLD